MVLSDDLVWAYSTETGGPLDASTFSIQVPQSTVLKSALHVLTALGVDASLVGTNTTLPSKTTRVHSEGKPDQANNAKDKLYLLNYGRTLPSGTSVLTLLREIAEEDRSEVEALQASNGTAIATKSAHPSRARRLSMESLSDNEVDMLKANNRYLLNDEPDDDAKKPAWAGKGTHKSAAEKKKKSMAAATASTSKDKDTTKKAAAKTISAQAKQTSVEGMSNTLIRLLSKVSAQDIARLQEGVRNVSKYFQFYALNSTLRTDVTPPAVHLRPTGGAMEMLEQALLQRKKAGVFDVGQRCQEERVRPGHKYIGNYPCEKRR